MNVLFGLRVSHPFSEAPLCVRYKQMIFGKVLGWFRCLTLTLPLSFLINLLLSRLQLTLDELVSPIKN